MPVSRSSALLEEVHPMIGQDGSSPHEAYLSQQGKDHSASPQHLPNTMGNENSDDEEDDDDSMAISSMARVWEQCCHGFQAHLSANPNEFYI